MKFPAFWEALRRWHDKAASEIFAPYAAAHPKCDGDPARVIAQTEFMQRPFSMPAWEAVKRVIDATPDLAAQFENVVGSDLGGSRLTQREVGLDFTARSLERVEAGGDGRLSKSEFDSLYEPLDEYLGNDRIGYQATALLLGLQCETVPMTLSDDVSIVLLDENDSVLTSLTMSLIDVAYAQIAQSTGGAFSVPPFYRHAFRKRFSMPKRIGMAGLDSDAALKTYTEIDADGKDCLRAIATAAFTRIIPWSTRITQTGWRERGSGWVTLPSPQTVLRIDQPQATLKAASEPILQAAWRHLKHSDFASKNGSIRAALDRLANLGTRELEDQVVDAVIACEGFFTHTAPGERHAEQAFRTAMNAAALSPQLGLDPYWTQPRVREFVSKAYNLRSRIVHGDEIKEKDRRVAGVFLDVNEFAYWSAEIVRRAIAWAFQHFLPGEPIIVKWDQFYFPTRT